MRRKPEIRGFLGVRHYSTAPNKEGKQEYLAPQFMVSYLGTGKIQNLYIFLCTLGFNGP